jgi:hypothetical protein
VTRTTGGHGLEAAAPPGDTATPTGDTAGPIDERAARTIDAFAPSRNGFHFANRFEPGPTVMFGPIDIRWFGGIGDASAGLCGGMSATVRDLFEAGIEPPPETTPPANGTARFKALVRRQVETLDLLRVPLRFYDLSAFRPSTPTMWSGLFRRRSVADVSLADEWPRIRAEIDAGRLAMVGLIRSASANPFRLTANHQVLAYGYRAEPNLVALRLYDPNWPDRDDVEARATLGAAARTRFESSTGEPLLGFFQAPYQRRTPVAWRS